MVSRQNTSEVVCDCTGIVPVSDIFAEVPGRSVTYCGLTYFVVHSVNGGTKVLIRCRETLHRIEHQGEVGGIQALS